MFDHIPKDVWKDPNLKWLDFANGIGNFPVIAYYKLFDSLKSWGFNSVRLPMHYCPTIKTPVPKATRG